jgi:protease YdgD
MNLFQSLAAPGFVGVLLAVGIGGCCFGGGTVPPVPITPPPVGGAGTPPPPPAAGPQAITLGAGFAPDPTTVAVAAGGPVAGSTMGAAGCAGNYPAAAQINLTLSAALPNLRVVGRATEDTTMAIRFPDGHVQCNDDGGGYPNPALDIANAAPGAYQIYIGSFGISGQGATSTVGFTTNLALQPAQLP